MLFVIWPACSVRCPQRILFPRDTANSAKDSGRYSACETAKASLFAADSVAPEYCAHRRAIGASDFQRQRREIINAGGHVAQVERFNNGNAGSRKRVMILQGFRIDLIH